MKKFSILMWKVIIFKCYILTEFLELNNYISIRILKTLQIRSSSKSCFVTSFLYNNLTHNNLQNISAISYSIILYISFLIVNSMILLAFFNIGKLEKRVVNGSRKGDRRFFIRAQPMQQQQLFSPFFVQFRAHQTSLPATPNIFFLDHVNISEHRC